MLSSEKETCSLVYVFTSLISVIALGKMSIKETVFFLFLHKNVFLWVLYSCFNGKVRKMPIFRGFIKRQGPGNFSSYLGSIPCLVLIYLKGLIQKT